MNQLNNILVAHDFSDCSRNALDYGVELALETGASLHFLHVEIYHEESLLTVPSAKSKAEQLREKLRQDIYESIKKQGFQPSDIPGIQYSVERDYSAAAAVNRYCAEKEVDLVVMGTHGRRGMAMRMKKASLPRYSQPLFLGSVAEAVVRTAPCSVFTLNERLLPKSLESSLTKITVPVTLTEEAVQAIQFARNMAAFYEVGLELLHVIEAWEVPPYYDANNMLVYDQREVRTRALNRLRELGEQAPGAEVPMTYEVLQGDPADEILRHLKTAEQPLVIMPINDVAGHWRDGIGSTVERVVRLANCPVLTYRERKETGKLDEAKDAETIAG